MRVCQEGSVSGSPWCKPWSGIPACCLDEATSALGPDSEKQVFANLLAQDCTLIVIAHRLSTVAEPDRTAV
ncbi:hypothetical protein [Peterkaempfera griseoplana]|uniref:hypothetical protein n=1 Tax=Peterkaempfera griseoplana TaxID=66896 RepID=UPI0012FEC8E5|nr:hypothetical protein [Peterkaempfera griseoplana]